MQRQIVQRINVTHRLTILIEQHIASVQRMLLDASGW